ncbi:SCO2322 family protein [Nonomuraea sp. NPDC003804]|uniref:SCO2322 family protein n=1 Tax=Nonomuraea sp. NPDC003804 TaxID=3154547 RepID=UPI0033A71C46
MLRAFGLAFAATLTVSTPALAISPSISPSATTATSPSAATVSALAAAPPASAPAAVSAVAALGHRGSGHRGRVLADPATGGVDPNAARRWSYWHSDGTAWLSGEAGAAVRDGAVIGWRFAAAPDGSAPESPRGELPAFDQVCGKEPAASGHQRVAVVTDFGDPDLDAYPGERPPASLTACVTAPEGATGVQALALATRVRAEPAGTVLAVNDYPARAKGGAAPSLPTTSSAPAVKDGGLPVAWIAGGVAALALVGAGVRVARRSRRRTTL